jgi:phosphonate transport system permease protein
MTGSKMPRPDDAASPPFKAPPPIFRARCIACWVMAAVAALVVASFLTLDLQWSKFFSLDSMQRMWRFVGELLVPATDPRFLGKLVVASAETLAMSAVGTLLAAIFGLLLALPASRTHAGDRALARAPTRLVLNALRSIPELVWAALLIISAGLGPFAGTLALAMHTTGVLGRLFAEAIENAPPAPAFALRTQGVAEGRCTRPCRRSFRNCFPTRCTGGKTTSAPPPCWAWSAPAAWARCSPSTWACSR